MKDLSLRARSAATAESGFSLVEMIIAITILAGSFLALSQMLFGAMNTVISSRERSVFLEVATAEMEAARAISYAAACAVTPLGPTYETGGTFEGRRAVLRGEDQDDDCAVVAETVVPGTSVITAHTVRRWVTWTDTSGGSDDQFKRITVEVDWVERQLGQRTMRLSSVLYPGGLQAAIDDDRPIAVATASPQRVVIGRPILFSAEDSSSENGPLAYTWNFGDGTITTETSPTKIYAYSVPGSYNASVTVRDANNAEANAIVQVIVGLPDPDNAPPTASFTRTPDTGAAPLDVFFDATASSDPEGDPLWYRWDWGDGSPVEEGIAATRTHTFSTGFTTYNVTLTVIDPNNGAHTTTRTVSTTTQNCAVTGAFFKNESMTNVDNRIRVKGNGAVRSTFFYFEAVTSTTCTSVTANLPRVGGTWSVPLTMTASTPTSKTWKLTTNVSSTMQFHVGTQAAVFRPSGTTGARNVEFTVVK